MASEGRIGRPNLLKEANFDRALKGEGAECLAFFRHRFPCELTCRFGPRIVDMTELLHHTMYG